MALLLANLLILSNGGKNYKIREGVCSNSTIINVSKIKLFVLFRSMEMANSYM